MARSEAGSVVGSVEKSVAGSVAGSAAGSVDPWVVLCAGVVTYYVFVVLFFKCVP